jgi:4-amino-4-deoxy-L-arabinose transferase-like glycosyltransferase
MNMPQRATVLDFLRFFLAALMLLTTINLATNQDGFLDSFLTGLAAAATIALIRGGLQK